MSESDTANPATQPPAPAKPENIWVNLICNVVLPGILLGQLSKPERLGPVWGLVVALAFPLGYGVWDLIHRRQFNFLSALGLVSVLMTGVLGLLKTDPFWFAVKAGAFASLMGLAIPLTLKTRRPLVKQLLYNDQVIDTEKVAAALAERGQTATLDALLRRVSWILAVTFLISGVVNFVMARWLVTAVSGTPEFNDQVGKLHLIEWPIITIPFLGVMIWCLFSFLKELGKLTGLSQDDLLRQPPTKDRDPNPQPWSRR
jgi:hypothetical protein